MASHSMVTVFSYDVQSDAIRRRVSALLEARTSRVQQSVFEAWLSEAESSCLFDAVEAELAPGDSLRMYVLSRAGFERSRVSGGAPLPEDGEYWLL